MIQQCLIIIIIIIVIQQCLIIIKIVIQVIKSLEYNYMITYTCFIIDLNYDHIQKKSDHDEQERDYEVVLQPVLLPLSR